MINVLITAFNFYPNIFGPVERFCRYSKGLKQRGVQLSIITPAGPPSKPFQTVNDIAVYTLPDTGTEVISREEFRRRAVNFAIKMSPKPDLVQFFNIENISDFLALFKLKQAGIGSLLVNTMSMHNSKDNSSLRFRLQTLKFNLIHRLLDRIVNSNEVLTEQYRNKGIPQKRLLTIVNGVALDRFRPAANEDEKSELRKKLNLPEGLIVLFVGNITPRKGIVELIKAWEIVHQKMPAHRLIIVGPQLRHAGKYKKFYQEWDEMLVSSNARESIHVRPPAPNIEEYFRAADLFVFLSKVEGMPNVLPETMASGLPLITAKFKGFSHEFGRVGREFVLTSREREEVSQQILSLLANEERRGKLSKNGHQWVKEHHDVEKSLDLFAGLYKSIVCGKRVRVKKRKLVIS